MAFISGEGKCHCTVSATQACVVAIYLYWFEDCKVNLAFNQQSELLKQQPADTLTGKTCWPNDSCESIMRNYFLGRGTCASDSF